MNKKVIILTVCVIIGMILFPTIYKVYQKHNEDLVTVVEKEFLYQAKKCFHDDECSNMVTLKDLYEKDYLTEKLTNPISKKYYLEESYINLDTEEIYLKE